MAYGMPAEEAQPEVPVCARHPDRVSYVRCQRCGLPACPECHRPAAVGIQCVDCVREAARNVPGRKTVYGGTARSGPPVVTWTLIGLCGVFFLLQTAVPGFTERFLYAPVYTSAYVPPEPWRMLSAAFLHSTSFLMHIAFNMYALWILGQALEPALGRARFLALYLMSAAGGSVAVLLLADPLTGVVGASGAVFGLFGALFVIQRRRGGDVRQLVVLLLINGALGFVVPGISWQAHLGGLVTGSAVAALYAYAPRGPRRPLWHRTGLSILALILAGAASGGAALLRLPV